MMYSYDESGDGATSSGAPGDSIYASRVVARAYELVFMRRCISDEAWRDRYIYVHDLPRPHMFSHVARMVAQESVAAAFMEIALSHADVEIGMRTWAADHGAEVLSYQDLSH